MSLRTWVNVITAALCAVVAVFVATTVLSSSALFQNKEDSAADKFRREAGLLAHGSDAGPAAPPAPESAPSRSFTQSPARPPTPTASPASPPSPAPAAPVLSDEELQKQVEEKEGARIDVTDPQRIPRREKLMEVVNRARDAAIDLRKNTDAAHVQAAEQAVEALRALPSDFREPSKGLSEYYDLFNEPIGFQEVEKGKGPTAADWKEFLAFLDRWHELAPDSVTPLVAKSRALLRFAWEARGSGFANTITEEGRNLFTERIQSAADALERAEKIGRPDAEFYCAQINVAKANGGDRELMFDALAKGQKLCPDYYTLYTAAAEFLLPRWHGEPGEVEQLANRLFDELKGDVGKLVFFRIAWIMHRYDIDLIAEGEYDPQKLRAAAAAFVDHHPLRPEFVRLALVAAWITEDYSLGKRCEELLKGLPRQDELVINTLWMLYGVDRFLERPPRADARPADFKLWQKPGVADLDFSPQGLAVASNHGDQPLKFYRTPEFSLAGGRGTGGAAIHNLRFLDNGSRLFMDLDDRATVHASIVSLRLPQENVLFDAVPSETRQYWAWTFDLRRVAGCDTEGRVRVWDGKSGAKEREFDLKLKHTLQLHFAASGEKLLVRHERGLTAIDAADGKTLWESGDKKKFSCSKIVGPAADGRLWVYGNFLDNQGLAFFLWSPEDFSMERILSAPGLSQWRVSGGGDRFVWCDNYQEELSIVVFDPLQRRETARIRVPYFPGRIALSPDHRWVAAGHPDGAVRVWRVEEDKK